MKTIITQIITGNRLKPTEIIMPTTKNNRRFNSIDVRNKYQPIFIHETEVTESRINNRMNNDVNKFKNAFNNNIDNNVTIRTPVINQFPEMHLVFLNKVKMLSQNIPSTMKQFVLVGKHMC